MKFLITSYMDNQEKEKIKNKGLYCYDLRDSDDGTEIATIERSVLVNRIGCIITDQEIPLGNKYPENYIDYETFVENNENVFKIEELLKTQPKKARFNTKIISDMKHNGEIVEVIGFSKGKDIYNDRYTIRFKDGTVKDNIMSIELEFDFQKNKTNQEKTSIKEREAR